jgi:hypothetical protein
VARNQATSVCAGPSQRARSRLAHPDASGALARHRACREGRLTGTTSGGLLEGRGCGVHGLPVTRADPLLRRRPVATAVLCPLVPERVAVDMAEVERFRGMIGRPHRAQSTPPPATFRAHPARNALCLAPYLDRAILSTPREDPRPQWRERRIDPAKPGTQGIFFRWRGIRRRSKPLLHPCVRSSTPFRFDGPLAPPSRCMRRRRSGIGQRVDIG